MAITETIVWTDKPSQLVNLKAFAMGSFFSALALIMPFVSIKIVWPTAALLLAWRYLIVRVTRYELSNERLRVISGVLTRTINEIELYRVVDTGCEQTIFERLMGLGTVMVVSSDRTTPIFSLDSIPQARAVREQVRDLVERRRDVKRVRIAQLE